jgi:hypothetical protein
LVNSGISITKERPKIALDNLFSGTKHKPMQPLRTIEEKLWTRPKDERLDDGAIKIGSDEEYQ